ncbi:MAG: efflux RND transporter permease subunit [Candidatus Omnitrophica bacterium]|nr:efflux RND transporter permease subunit [Candidatus Omnitrophota bacterium]
MANSEPREGVIERVIEFSARNKFLVFTFVIASVLGSIWAIRRVPLDAIPDLSDTQVTIYSRWDRSPDIIEDQVTYPIVSALLGAPHVKAIRGFSDFGFSYVYVIFEDGTDIYWARSRALEYLSKITPTLPEGVRTELGPDATGVGWVYQYALVDRTGQHNLQELRSFQDWSLRYHLQAVQGVAEVASLGGFVKQYQITVDPNRLLAYDLPLTRVIEAVRKGNQEVGGRLLEFSGVEFMVRSRGYATSMGDLEQIVVGTDGQGTPILVKHIATVSLGPEIRRGLADLDGQGDVVTGTVVMRYGENALNVIDRVKTRLEEVKPSFPPGVELVTLYDRSELIRQSIETLKEKLTEEMLVVALVIIFFLWHFRSALIPIIMLPIAVLLSFLPMYSMGLTSNIMSLGGIAIAVGAMVDAAIVLIENAHKRIERWKQDGQREPLSEVLIRAAKEVGRPIFFSLLVIAVSFIPIFSLEAQEGRLFKPLAFTKNYAMAFAAVLAVTLVPALMVLLIRERTFALKPAWLNRIVTFFAGGQIHAEEQHPVSRVLFRLYEPAVRWVLAHRKRVVAVAAALVVATVPVYFVLGREFMPQLNEGSILYMPTTLPGISVTEAQQLLQTQDQILKSFPEVERVFGKAGRIESSTDPAPFSMMETVVTLKPQRQWRRVRRWYSWLPGFLKGPFGRIWPETISYDHLIGQMDQALKIPGTTNAWTMPIKNRIDMLTTGVRTPIGIKIFGDDLKRIEETGAHLEMILKDIPGTRSIYAERVAGGYFVDFDLKRDELARYGLSVDEAQMIVMSAIGGENITTTVEGRERYPVNVRYPRELRDDLEKLERVLVPTPTGQHIPLAQIADIVLRSGPAMIRNENGLLAGYVYVDMAGRDIGSYVTEAKRAVRERLTLPPGYALSWSGQYEYMARVAQRLLVVVPVTLFLIFFLLYLNTRSLVKTGIVLLAVPFSLIGAFWLLWLLGYNLSIAVWVGLIALAGVDAETGVIMLLYLDLAFEDAKREGRLRTFHDLEEAIVHGAVKRIRPKMMTVMTTFMGLLPIMWAASWETGADVMKRIAAPMVGGIFTSFIMELLVYPAIYAIWKWRFEMREGKAAWISRAA